MKIQINDSKKYMEWCEIFKFIKNVNPHISMTFNIENLYIQLMDGAHVCLIDISIPKDWFDVYENNTTQVISLTSSVLVKINSMYTKDSIYEINLNDESSKLEIHFYNSQQNKHFEIPLLEIERDVLSPTIIETLLDFNIKSSSFDKYITELSNFGDDVIISCKDDRLNFQTSSDEGSLNIEIEGDTLQDFSVVENYVFSAKFPIKYLSLISKLSLNYTHTHLYLDESNPLRITFDDSKIIIQYFLAPKVED